jgi:hypothetical protein
MPTEEALIYGDTSQTSFHSKASVRIKDIALLHAVKSFSEAYIRSASKGIPSNYV